MPLSFRIQMKSEWLDRRPSHDGGVVPLGFADARCALCKGTARRIKIQEDLDLFDLDCGSCGRYRTGRLAEATYAVASPRQVADIVWRIQQANDAGRFIRLGSLQEFPLANWGLAPQLPTS